MGKKTKVVIDVNVFISAFGWNGKPLQIMELLEKGKLRNCISEEILRELSIAISYPELSLTKEIQAKILEFALIHSDFYEPTESAGIARDPDDNKFIDCALSAKAKFIITGDEDLLSIKQYKHIKFVSPAEFLRDF